MNVGPTARTLRLLGSASGVAPVSAGIGGRGALGVAARGGAGCRGAGRWRGGLAHRLRLLLGDHDVATLHGRIPDLAEGVRPALAGQPAAAGRDELATVAERILHVLVEPPVVRHRLGDVLAGIAVGVERDLGGGAELLARLLVFREPRRRGRVGDREVVAVAGAHTQRAIAAGADLGIVALSGRCDHRAGATEQRLEEAALLRAAAAAAL